MFVISRALASLFYQILYMSVVSSVIGLVIVIIQKIAHKKIAPKYNHYIWFVFIFVLIFPISVSSRFSVYNIINFNDIKIVDQGYNGNIFDFSKISKSTQNERVNGYYNNAKLLGNNTKIIIADIILLISMLKIFKNLIIFKWYNNQFENEFIENDRILSIINECKKELKIKRNIKIINQDIVDSPAIIGLFNVKILFSKKLLVLDDNTLKNMLLHELSHYKRKDNYINFLIMILKSIYWFNPVVTYIFKYIKQNIEFATDELVIKNMNLEEKREYCKTIIDAEARNSSCVPVLAFSGEFKYMEKRIELISLSSKFKNISKITSLLTASIVFLICLFFYPTSYCNSDRPNIYLQTDDGLNVQILDCDETNDFQEIIIKQGTDLKVVSNNSSHNSNIYFNSADINANNLEDKTSTSVINNKFDSLEKGEYLYKFTVVNGNNTTFDYKIKIKVV